MFYRGYIKNTNKDVWLSEEINGEVQFTPSLEKAIVFHDLQEALITVEHLNEVLSDCYTLIEDDTNSVYLKNELEGKYGVNDKAIVKIIDYLNLNGHYHDIIAEVEYDKDEGRPIIQIRAFEGEEEVHHYLFETNGDYFTDYERL